MACKCTIKVFLFAAVAEPRRSGRDRQGSRIVVYVICGTRNALQALNRAAQLHFFRERRGNKGVALARFLLTFLVPFVADLYPAPNAFQA
ncbi:hypothetical protein UB46_22455 [Burkholderiaceae bacterium 16]|nr:hypothetical protein UB46_22455 [Burkholderiaceae bacterium 16]